MELPYSKYSLNLPSCIDSGDKSIRYDNTIWLDAFPIFRLISPKPARQEQLRLFHSVDYIECLKKLSDEDDDEKHGEDAELCGLSKEKLCNHNSLKYKWPVRKISEGPIF